VAHRGQEFALGQHRRFGRLLGLQQLLFQAVVVLQLSLQVVALGFGHGRTRFAAFVARGQGAHAQGDDHAQQRGAAGAGQRHPLPRSGDTGHRQQQGRHSQQDREQSQPRRYGQPPQQIHP
jgi:hypothetical protein